MIMEMLQTLFTYFQYPFVRYALIVGVLISLCSSILGVTLVLKRFSFIGDGLSHVAFGAMSVAAIVGLTNKMIIALPVTIIAAVILLCAGQNTRIKGDASIAVLSVSALAVGYLLMNLFPSTNNVSGDVCSSLFGSTSILTLSSSDVWICIVLSIVVISAFIILYNKIFAITFDEDFAKTSGTAVRLYNLILATIIAIIIVLAMNLVGSLLISALVVFPAISAMRVCKNFKAVTICAACISVGSSLVGIVASIAASTPVGSTIVIVDLLVFILFSLIGKLRGGKRA